MQTTEILAEFKGLLNGQVGEILVPEGHNLLLCHEQGKFVLACIVELRELDAADFGAD